MKRYYATTCRAAMMPLRRCRCYKRVRVYARRCRCRYENDNDERHQSINRSEIIARYEISAPARRHAPLPRRESAFTRARIYGAYMRWCAAAQRGTRIPSRELTSLTSTPKAAVVTSNIFNITLTMTTLDMKGSAQRRTTRVKKYSAV